MKSLMARALTTAAVLGAALLGTAGTSPAADGLPDGTDVVGHGTGATEADATANAHNDASGQCASRTSVGRPEASVTTRRNSNGTWSATFTSRCFTSPGIGG